MKLPLSAPWARAVCLLHPCVRPLPCRAYTAANDEKTEAAPQPVPRDVVLNDLRVDVVAAHCLKLSRNKARLALLAGEISVNGRPIVKKSLQIAEGDTVAHSQLPRVLEARIETVTTRTNAKGEEKFVVTYVRTIRWLPQQTETGAS